MSAPAAAMPPNRFEAFSDGVFAIVITLLVIEIKVPEVHGADVQAELADALLHLVPKVIGYLISFVTIAIFWVNHYVFVHALKRIDWPLVWWNNALLLVLAFVPFPTGVLGEYPGQALAVTLYGIVLALAAAAFAQMRRHAVRSELMQPHARGGLGRSYAAPLLYLAGAALGAAVPLLGIAMYVVVPLLFVGAPRQGTKSEGSP